MSRYMIHVEKNHGEEPYGEVTDYYDVIYGFDTGGLLGVRSPAFGFFLQAWLVDEWGIQMEMTYHETGGKSSIIESPFWDEIVKLNPDHSMKIALDLPF